MLHMVSQETDQFRVLVLLIIFLFTLAGLDQQEYLPKMIRSAERKHVRN